MTLKRFAKDFLAWFADHWWLWLLIYVIIWNGRCM